MHVLTRERQQDAESAALTASADYLSDELLSALRKGDMDAPALFAPMVPDWSSHLMGNKRPKRHQTVGEVVMGQAGTKAFNELTRLVCRLGYSAESHANLATQARTILHRIAADFGDNHATGETA